MVRFCCPKSKVDWSEHRGLLCCNWPCCFEATPDDALKVVQSHSDATTLLIELEAPTEMMPSFVFLVTALVIYTPLLLCMLDCNRISAWHFKLDQANQILNVEQRDKTQYSEKISQRFTCIVYAQYLTEEETDQDTSYRYTSGRIVLHNDTGARLASVKKKITDDSVERACDRINALIPARFRTQRDEYERRFNTVIPEVVAVEPTTAVVEIDYGNSSNSGSSSSNRVGAAGIDKNHGDDYAATAPPSAAPVGYAPVSSTIIEDTDNRRDTADTMLDRNTPLREIIALIKRELGIVDDPEQSVADVVRVACKQLGISEGITIRDGAVAAAKELGYSFRD